MSLSLSLTRLSTAFLGLLTFSLLLLSHSTSAVPAPFQLPSSWTSQRQAAALQSPELDNELLPSSSDFGIPEDNSPLPSETPPTPIGPSEEDGHLLPSNPPTFSDQPTGEDDLGEDVETDAEPEATPETQSPSLSPAPKPRWKKPTPESQPWKKPDPVVVVGVPHDADRTPSPTGDVDPENDESEATSEPEPDSAFVDDIVQRTQSPSPSPSRKLKTWQKNPASTKTPIPTVTPSPSTSSSSSSSSVPSPSASASVFSLPTVSSMPLSPPKWKEKQKNETLSDIDATLEGLVEAPTFEPQATVGDDDSMFPGGSSGSDDKVQPSSEPEESEKAPPAVVVVEPSASTSVAITPSSSVSMSATPSPSSIPSLSTSPSMSGTASVSPTISVTPSSSLEQSVSSSPSSEPSPTSSSSMTMSASAAPPSASSAFSPSASVSEPLPSASASITPARSPWPSKSPKSSPTSSISISVTAIQSAAPSLFSFPSVSMPPVSDIQPEASMAPVESVEAPRTTISPVTTDGGSASTDTDPSSADVTYTPDAMPSAFMSVEATAPESSGPVETLMASPGSDPVQSTPEANDTDDLRTPGIVLNQEASGTTASPSPLDPPIELFPPVGSSPSPTGIPSASGTPSVSSGLTTSTPSISPTASVSVSPSAAPSSPPPETISDADTVIVPKAPSETIDPSESIDPDDALDDADDNGPNETAFPVLPPQGASDAGGTVVGVPDRNDSGIVEDAPGGGSNTTLADEDGTPTTVVAGEKYKDILGTGPAGPAFVPIMCVVGVLLVLLLGFCLFYVIFYGAGVSTYSYNTHTRPSEYGATQGGGSGGDGPGSGGSPPMSGEGMGAGGGGGGPTSGTYASGTSYGQEAPQVYSGGGGGGVRAEGEQTMDEDYGSRTDVGGVSYGNDDGYPMGATTTLKNASVGTADYPGARTTLKNASVGTADYSAPSALAEEIRRGALAGYDEQDGGPDTSEGYPYAHPYGHPYEDGGAEARSSYRQSSASDVRQGDQDSHNQQEGDVVAESYYRQSEMFAQGDTETRDTYGNELGYEGQTEDTYGNESEDHAVAPNLNRQSVWMPNAMQQISAHNEEHGERDGDGGVLGRTSMSRGSLGDVIPHGQTDSTGSSNPAPATPYESGVPVQVAENDADDVARMAFTDMTNGDLGVTLTDVNGNNGVTLTDANGNGMTITDANGVGMTIAEQGKGISGGESGNGSGSKDDQQKQYGATLSEALRTSQRSNEPNSGPWPSWWNGNENQGIDNSQSDPTSMSKENELPTNGNDNDRKKGGLVSNARTIFGEVEDDSSWQRQSHRNKNKDVHREMELDPEYDYLRKRREPYVKVVANRLSMVALSDSPSENMGLQQSGDDGRVMNQDENVQMDPPTMNGNGAGGYDLGANNQSVAV